MTAITLFLILYMEHVVNIPVKALPQCWGVFRQLFFGNFKIGRPLVEVLPLHNYISVFLSKVFTYGASANFL